MNLFNISGWTGVLTYSQYDPVYITVTGKTFYYYSTTDSNTAHPTGANDKWTRFPIIAFAPSYNTNLSFTYNNKKAQYGDGYVQRLSNNLDSQKLGFSLTYTNISKKKAVAILSFIEESHATEPFVFNPSGIFKKGNSFIAEAPKVTFNNYNSYSIDCNISKEFRLGGYYDTINLDVMSSNIVYFFSGLSIEPGQYRIQYNNGVAATAASRWFETTHYDIYYNNGDNQYQWNITGNGTGTNESWSTEDLGSMGMKRSNPYTIINHTGGRLGISFFDSNYTDNSSGIPALSYSLHKIADL